jgi:two-component system phosphate regulon sensor histidine kinase PhoR
VVLQSEVSGIFLDVIDNGPGIDGSELPRIFERFYRSPSAQNGSCQGTGLGLSLAVGLAERNHAKIEVSSQPGKGSTFRVLFQSAA